MPHANHPISGPVLRQAQGIFPLLRGHRAGAILLPHGRTIAGAIHLLPAQVTAGATLHPAGVHHLQGVIQHLPAHQAATPVRPGAADHPVEAEEAQVEVAAVAEEDKQENNREIIDNEKANYNIIPYNTHTGTGI